MVLKPRSKLPPSCPGFENDVKMYGTQAFFLRLVPLEWFENDVKMYGTQAIQPPIKPPISFENDVKMYGTQAKPDDIASRAYV